MCLGVPGLVTEVDDMMAVVDFWGVKRRVRLDLCDEAVQPGDYVLNHVGFAIRRIPAEDVQTTLEMYEQILRENTGKGPEDLMAADVRGEIEGRPVMNPLEFRDPQRARELSEALERTVTAIGRNPVSVMHVCGSHEQAIARFGLRATLPRALNVIMGPGCPVCITDMPEIDEGVALALQGVRVATYGDMIRVPGSAGSLADARAQGAKVDVVYSVAQAADLARETTEEIVFFGTGFETTAVATAAILLNDPPKNFSVLSAHKFIPPVMEIVSEMPGTRVEGFLAAGHAATITGSGIFEPFVARHHIPVVVAGFEPLDILAALLRLTEMIRDGQAEVSNMSPRCVTREGNRNAQEQLWKVFRPIGGRWRGIAHIPNGNLRLRDEFAHVDARKRFAIDVNALWQSSPSSLVRQCICGNIMAGIASPHDCPLFGKECVPDAPVGACMVSSEGTCKIWHQHGGVPDLRAPVIENCLRCVPQSTDGGVA